MVSGSGVGVRISEITTTVCDPSGRPRYLIDSHRPIPELIG